MASIAPRQVLRLLFEGLDTFTDPRSAPPGRLEVIENAYQRRKGEWRKRPGTTALTRTTSSGTIAVGKRLAAYAGELVQQTDGGIHSYSDIPAGANALWSNRGAIGSALYDHAPVTSSLMEVSSLILGNNIKFWHDAAYGNGLICVAYGSGNSTTSFYVLIDAASGRFIGAPVALSYNQAKVVHAGGFFLIFENLNGNANIDVLKINSLTRATTQTNGIATNANATLWMSAITRDDNGQALLAWRNNAGTLSMLRWDPATNTSPTGTVTHAVNVSLCGEWLWHDFTNANAYLATGDGAAGVVKRVYDKGTLALVSNTVVDAAATTARNVTGWFNGATDNVLYEIPDGTTSYNHRVNINAASQFARSVALGSRVMKIGAAWYVLLAYDSTLQGTYFLSNASDLSAQNIVARTLSTVGSGATTAASRLPSLINVGGSKYFCSVGRKTSILRFLTLTLITHGLTSVTYDFADAAMGTPKDIAGQLLIPGASPQLYDGRQVVEAGFHLYPEAGTATVIAGGAAAAGVYQMIAVYSWIDGQGRLCRSRPSPSWTATTAAGNLTIRNVVPNLRITSRTDVNGPVRIELYRLDPGTVVYRRVPLFTTSSVSADATTIDDGFSSTEVATGEFLYTTGNVKENYPPPPCKVLEVHTGRAVVINSEDARELWISKPLKTGFGIAWSADITTRGDGGDGEFRALGALDDKLVGLKRTAIYAVTGVNLPNDLGQGVDQLDVQRIVTGVGCVNPSSVAAGPPGLFYESEEGIRLLSSGLQDSYVGAQVDAYNDLTITGAAVMGAPVNQARFVTAEGRTLIYDWTKQTWHTATGQPAVGCCVWNGKFVHLASDGTCSVETAGQFQDGTSTTITTSWESAWIDFANARLDEIRVVFEGRATGTMRLRIFYDYDEVTVGDTVSKAFASSSRIPFKYAPKKDRAQAIKVILDDVGSAAGAEGFRLSRFDIAYEGKLGLEPLPSAQVMT